MQTVQTANWDIRGSRALRTQRMICVIGWECNHKKMSSRLTARCALYNVQAIHNKCALYFFVFFLLIALGKNHYILTNNNLASNQLACYFSSWRQVQFWGEIKAFCVCLQAIVWLLLAVRNVITNSCSVFYLSVSTHSMYAKKTLLLFSFLFFSCTHQSFWLQGLWPCSPVLMLTNISEMIFYHFPWSLSLTIRFPLLHYDF